MSLFLRVVKEKPSSVGHLHRGKEGKFNNKKSRLWCELNVNYMFLCTTFHRRLLLKRKMPRGTLCLGSFPGDFCCRWCGYSDKINTLKKFVGAFLNHLFLFIFQEASLHSSDFWAFRRWKLAFLHWMWPLLQRKTSGCWVLHGVEETNGQTHHFYCAMLKKYPRRAQKKCEILANFKNM